MRMPTAVLIFALLPFDVPGIAAAVRALPEVGPAGIVGGDGGGGGGMTSSSVYMDDDEGDGESEDGSG